MKEHLLSFDLELDNKKIDASKPWTIIYILLEELFLKEEVNWTEVLF